MPSCISLRGGSTFSSRLPKSTVYVQELEFVITGPGLNVKVLQKFGNLIPVECDLNDNNSIQRLVDIVKARHGYLNLLINNAGLALNILPKLPTPETGDIRVMADGFGRPNGLCFSPDERTMYVTDTDWIHGDGSRDLTRASTM